MITDTPIPNLPDEMRCAHKAYGLFRCHFVRTDGPYCRTHAFLIQHSKGKK